MGAVGASETTIFHADLPVGMRGIAAAAARAFGIAAAVLAAFAAAPAARAEAPVFVSPGDMHSGALLLKSVQEGRYVEAPRLGTDIGLTVSGPTARARVTQIFQNPTSGWIEAVYVYPLPDDSAVDTLKMIIGERIIVADVKEREQARRDYEIARAAGQKAGLLEQERPNMFTSSVANIGPGETVLVQIEYQEPVRQSGGEFSLRVPLVVAPRYNPAPLVQTVDFSGRDRGWATVSDPVPDRARIEPPVLDPRSNPPINPVAITVHLNAGFPLGEVKSHHHAVRTETLAPDNQTITLAEGPVPADRDFELTWRAAETKAPSVGLFHERVGEADYALVFVTPPAVERSEDKRPREIVFVIDNSGSMGGTSIVQAKESLMYALGRLQPSDRFNVIRFDNTMDVLFGDTVPAHAEHVARARDFVTAIEAHGGTEMVPPMQAALTDRRGAGENYLRQVVFLTDGEIGNEQQLFDTISRMGGRSRLFMVGIGSAPNTFLMTRAAELGSGAFTHIGSVAQVEERMRVLFDKLESPVVTNLTATFSAGGGDVTPAVFPDLYRGEPLVIAAKLAKLDGSLEVRGVVGERPWIVTLPLGGAAEGQGLSKLWARRKIADVEVARTMQELAPEEADRRILALALDHHLVTRLTSLVAIDKTPSRPEGAHLSRAELPLNLPAGWDFETLFGEKEFRGERRPPAEPESRRADNGVYAQLVAAAAPSAKPLPIQAAAPAGVALPKTATDAELRLLAGLALCLTSLLILALRRRAARASARF